MPRIPLYSLAQPIPAEETGHKWYPHRLSCYLPACLRRGKRPTQPHLTPSPAIPRGHWITPTALHMSSRSPLPTGTRPRSQQPSRSEYRQHTSQKTTTMMSLEQTQPPGLASPARRPPTSPDLQRRGRFTAQDQKPPNSSIFSFHVTT